jgi:adenylylsulfate kinase-like enzyme
MNGESVMYGKLAPKNVGDRTSLVNAKDCTIPKINGIIKNQTTPKNIDLKCDTKVRIIEENISTVSDQLFTNRCALYSGE